MTDPSDGQPIAPGPYPWPTIDDLFQLVLDAQAGGADTLDITYDPSYSFPAKGYIDYDVNATDDELHFTATDFAPE